MPVELTAKAIDALPPKAERYVVRDAKVSGLEIRVSADGEKTWSLRYRVLGQQRRLKLGVFPRLSLAAARTAANKELRKVDGGVDPQAERQAAKLAAELAKKDTIDALARAYIERHAKVHKRTWRDDQSMLKTEVLPPWKGRTVSSISRRDCRELIQKIAARPAPIYANRVGALLSRLFRFAVEDDVVSASPAAHLPKPGSEASTRKDAEMKAYAADEVRVIWTATEELPASVRAICRLGLLTGQRPGEIAGMEWAEIDGAWWSIPGTRTKNGREQRVFLTQSALDELARVPKVEKHARVFAGYLGKRQQAEQNAIVFKDVRKREKPRHALRDTVATGLAECGVAIEDISKVLNHLHGSPVTAIYNAYRYDKEKRLALMKWERRLQAMLNATEQSSKVRSFVQSKSAFN